MYSMTTTSVMKPELATKKPCAQECRPQHSLLLVHMAELLG